VTFTFNAEIIEFLRKKGITVEKILDGYLHGKHRSPFFGHSLEFKDLRAYEKGDDIKFIDWRLYGRTEKFFVKKYEEETNIRVYIILDVSRSMSLDRKGEVGRGVAAIFAFLSYLSRDACGLFLFNEREVFFRPPSTTYSNLQNLMKALEDFRDSGKTDFLNAMLDLEKRIKKRSLLITVSDFLCEFAQLQKFLRFFKSKGHEILVFPIISRRELEELQPGILLRDSESSEEIAATREMLFNYRKRIKEHYFDLNDLFTHYGIKYNEFYTDLDLTLQVRKFLEI